MSCFAYGNKIIYISIDKDNIPITKRCNFHEPIKKIVDETFKNIFIYQLY